MSRLLPIIARKRKTSGSTDMNYFAIGFGAVALTAVGAIDYVNQAGAAGETPGRFGPGVYFATYSARVEAVREARAVAADAKGFDQRRKAGARASLPDAPDGWARRAWLDGDNSAVSVSPPSNSSNNTPDLLKNMAAKSAKADEKHRDSETWVYQQGEQIIALRARYQPRDDVRSLTGAVADKLAANAFVPRVGWAVIGGVAYSQTSAEFGTPGVPFVSEAGMPFLAYEAPIGFHDSVQISVLSNASEAAVRAVLGAIDYDGLNALLTYPLVYVGTNAPAVPIAAQPHMADLMFKMQSDLLSRRGAVAQAWMQRAMTPENAMKLVMNELATGWGTGWSTGGIPHPDPGAEPAASSQPGTAAQTLDRPSGQIQASDTSAPLATDIAGIAASLLGGGAAKMAKEAASKPKRLTLSGGSSCLAGSAGKFCRD
jgi:hypothetical protein